MRGRGIDPVTGELDPAAYERVSDPARFAPLHDVARALTENLVARYDVEVAELPAAGDDAPVPGGPRTIAAWRLDPADPDASALTFTLTSFPGLVLTFGRTASEAYPTCGCDACDEDVEDVEPQLRATVDAVVAGHLEESLTFRGGLQPWLEVALGAEGWRSTSGQAISRQRARELGGRWQVRAAPWPRRAASDPG